MASDTAENVRKVFAIQEQRQTQYSNLKKAQEKYVSQEWTHQQYQSTMSEVTATFQSLSQEILHLIGIFDSSGLKEVVRILKELQLVEKEKLELMVKWQLMNRQEDNCDEEMDDFGAALHQKRELKKKHSVFATQDLHSWLSGPNLPHRLAAVESSIAELMQDLRYECEPFLVSASSSMN